MFSNAVLTNPSMTYPEPPASEATDDPTTEEDPNSTEESGETDDADNNGEFDIMLSPLPSSRFPQ